MSRVVQSNDAPPLARVNPGDTLSAAEWNRLRQAVLGLVQQQLGNANLNVYMRAGVVMMRIKSSNGDYWTCRKYDGTTEETSDIYVAKPFELRPSVTSLGTQTYSYTTDIERSATDGTSETQVMTPPFVANESVIWAARARATGVIGPSSEQIFWLDVNTAGRAWAQKFGT